MKILIIQDHLRIGGTERQSLLLAHTFQEEGHQVTLMTFRPGGHLATTRVLDELEIEVLQAFDSRIALWAPGLMRRIRACSPSIILCMGRTANCYAGFIQRRFPRIPVVGTLRTGKAVFPLQHWSMGQVRAVLVNSNWWRRRLLERGFPEARIHVVHNAVLLERPADEHRRQRIEMRARYAIEPEQCVFLNVATFRRGKRHLDLLRIFAELRRRCPELPWRLWLVGDGPEYRRCRRWSAENGLGTRVRFFHFQHDPFPFYAASDVAVTVSREDSLPNFLVEAQATRLPVLAYDCRGINETCQPGATGQILAAGDEAGMLDSLARFAADPELRARYAAGAPAFAAERFSRQTQARAVMRFLEQLADAGA
jgi:glycosyltransferase involved in cell wall biosynthesis